LVHRHDPRHHQGSAQRRSLRSAAQSVRRGEDPIPWTSRWCSSPAVLVDNAGLSGSGFRATFPPSQGSVRRRRETGPRANLSSTGASVDPQAALGYAFNAVVTDGQAGLFTRGGASSFANYLVKTDDPKLIGVVISNAPDGEAWFTV
jgi:hypothetical protein